MSGGRISGPARGAATRPAFDSHPVLHRIRRSLRHAAPALYGYAATRLMLLTLLTLRAGPHHTITRLASAWDARWYSRIVRFGYGGSSHLYNVRHVEYSARAFFPLFPGLAAPLHQLLPVSAGVSLLIVSWTSGLVAAWGIHACAAFCHSRRVGVAAAVLWGVLPLAAVESMGYSESLFTAFCAWSLYAVLRHRWIWAGSLCLLAGLTRPNAMALTGALGVAALVQLYRWRRDGGGLVAPWRPLAGMLLAQLGWLSYIVWTGWVENSWTAYFRIQDAWSSSFDGGWSTLHWAAALFQHYHRGRGDSVNNLLMAVTVLAALALFGWSLRRRQPLPLVLFSGLMLVMDLGNSSPYPPLARFLIPAFPLLFPLAEQLTRSVRNRWTLAALFALLALCSGYYGIDLVFFAGAPS